jgi:tRNA pseudouridine38-40 synthase
MTRPSAEAPVRRIALLLEYDGSSFAGSQWQKNSRTVQSELENAIAKTTQAAARVAFAGRTDAGVHARGQVASFDTSSELPATTLMRALNAWLPEDLAVIEAVDAHDGIDVRRDAVRRHYQYVIETRAGRPVLERRRAWHVRGELNLEAMQTAAGRLVGKHDFAAFASPLESSESSTVREIFCFGLHLLDTQLVVDVRGNAFLPHQVRRMVGALVEVGRGKLTAQAYEGLLDGPPSSAGPAAPAHGLCLMRVDYEPQLFRATLASAIGVC